MKYFNIKYLFRDRVLAEPFELQPLVRDVLPQPLVPRERGAYDLSAVRASQKVWIGDEDD